MTTLVTGAAGFIGSHVVRRLLVAGDSVIGVDNLNDYYNVDLKRYRLSKLSHPQFSFIQADVGDLSPSAIHSRPDRVIHLAAQAGVRYSLSNPEAYVRSNLSGFFAVLELARAWDCAHLVYASSSSVYGANAEMPFSERHEVNHPLSLYAATKRSNELMADTYSHLYQIPATGLRFFTVYGPAGRPDMAIFDFTRRILAGEPIELFGGGELSRDFTYVDDIVDGILLALERAPEVTNEHGSAINNGGAPHRVFNIGRGQPVRVSDMVDQIEATLGVPARRVLAERQPGDVDHTWADISQFQAWCGFSPRTGLQEGVANFAEWYLRHHDSRGEFKW